MAEIQNNSNKILILDLWRPFISRVPLRFRAALIQKEFEWNINMLKGVLTLWTAWFFGLIVFSDMQKDMDLRMPYIAIRSGVISVSLFVQFYLRRQSNKRPNTSLTTIFLSSLYLSAYLGFSFYNLPLRTTWVTILPAAFILATPRSGRGAFVSYSLLMTAGLLIFHQKINSIWVISDILFGFVLIGAGLIIKELWARSIILMLEQEEAQRTALQNEISILEAVETFIPKGIRSKIRSGLAQGSSISTVIKEMSKPTEQYIAVLYSDYRNYSRKSSQLDFIEKELITSSQAILGFAEDCNAIVQNKGDSILAAFLGDDQGHNVVRALLSGLQSAKSEFDRITAAGKSEPDRYMIVTSGSAVFCSLGNESRHEFTIAGKPANLAARLDELTKNVFLKGEIIRTPAVLFDYETKNQLLKLGLGLTYEEINLRDEKLEVRTYFEEKRVFVIRYSDQIILTLNDFNNSSNKNLEIA